MAPVLQMWLHQGRAEGRRTSVALLAALGAMQPPESHCNAHRVTMSRGQQLWSMVGQLLVNHNTQLLPHRAPFQLTPDLL